MKKFAIIFTVVLVLCLCGRIVSDTIATQVPTTNSATTVIETTIRPTTKPTTAPTTEPTTTPTTEPVVEGYPKIYYSSSSGTITIHKEWYENAWCYIAHLELIDYTKFGTACANGSYNNGREKASHAAERLGAIFVVNGDYSTPSMGNGVVRSGVVCVNKKCAMPGIYSSKTGILCSPKSIGANGKKFSKLASDQTVTDTFGFFGKVLIRNGKIVKESSDRAQRTFIGTNGEPGDIWIVVSEGRYVDGESAGLTHNQCARLLLSKGCTFAVPLDGGGSSTMVFNGEVLNHLPKDTERAVVDFVYFMG